MQRLLHRCWRAVKSTKNGPETHRLGTVGSPLHPLAVWENQERTAVLPRAHGACLSKGSHSHGRLEMVPNKHREKEKCPGFTRPSPLIGCTQVRSQQTWEPGKCNVWGASSAPPSPWGTWGKWEEGISKGHLAQCVDMNPQRRMPYFMPWICPGGGN